MQADEKQLTGKKRRGCFLWGCLTLGIFFSLVGGCTGLVLHQSCLIVKKEYTSDKPADLPIYKPTLEEWEQIEGRIKDFQQAVEEERSAELILTADDLNAIISKSEQAGKIYFNIEGDEVTALVTVYLDRVICFSGRYFNATYSVTLAIENGILVITPTALKIEGKELPSEAIDNLNLDNFTKEVNKNEDVQKLLKNVKEFYAEDGKLIVKR